MPGIGAGVGIGFGIAFAGGGGPFPFNLLDLSPVALYRLTTAATAFQDADTTTPLAGDPVGLLLDQSQGVEVKSLEGSLGPELATPTTWNVGGGWTSNGDGSFTKVGGASGWLNVGTAGGSLGDSFLLSFTLEDWEGSLGVFVRNDTDTGNTLVLSAGGSGHYEIIVKSSTAREIRNGYFTLDRAVASGTLRDLSVRRLTPLSERLTGLGPEIAIPENIGASGGWTSNGDGSFTKTADQNGQLNVGLNGGEAYDTFLVSFTLDTDWVDGLNVFVRSEDDTFNELYAAATGTGRHEFVVKTRTLTQTGLFNLNKFPSSGTLRDLSVRKLPGKRLSQSDDDDFRPTLVQSGGGYALDFDGVDDYLSAPTRLGLDANPALTVVAVLNTGDQSSGADLRVWQIGENFSDGVLAGAIGREGLSWRHNGGAVKSNQIPNNTDVVVSWRRQAGDTYGDQELFINGEIQVGVAVSNASGVPTSTTENLFIGGQTSSNFFTGTLYSIAFFPATLSDEDLRAVENQMVAEAGITFPTATGGVETLIEQEGKYYRVHTFGAGSGKFVASRDIANAERLLVAGGGGGGAGEWDSGGGGDGGQPIFVAGPIAAGNYPVNVGAGGAGGTHTAPPTNGASSAAFGDTAIGGGAGGHNRGVGQVGWGSGGTAQERAETPPTGPSGFHGGTGTIGTPDAWVANAGGGSGAGGDGQHGSPTTGVQGGDPGMGGLGIVYDISGTAIEYSKGGAGKNRFDADLNGIPGSTSGSGGEATHHTSSDNTRTGGAGADGICIVRYEITRAEYLGIDIPEPAATGGVETLIQDGADYYRVHTFHGENETLTHARDVEIEILAVGSGGGASNNSFGSSGGGGGGEVVTATAMLDGDLNISVGQAPAPIRAWELSSTDRVYEQGNPGNDTAITGALAITAEGGNFGGCGHNRDTQLGNGGSSKRGGGGGAGSGQGPSTLCFGGISAGSGNGADGGNADVPRRAGGGGGYYDAPVIPADAGGDAGHGFLSSITGTPVYYGCGGPGGYRGGTATVGNAAPGGAAIDENGQPGTGNGAGGSVERYLPPAVGGSGICVIRYKITQAEYEAV